MRTETRQPPYTSIVQLDETSTADLTKAWLSANLPTSQIERVLELASYVFEDSQFARNWLEQPNLATYDKPPIALLGTEKGLKHVETLLRRIEYGILA